MGVNSDVRDPKVDGEEQGVSKNTQTPQGEHSQTCSASNRAGEWDEWPVRELSSSPRKCSFNLLASQLPRVLIVSRRHVRKQKFVDFVGEFHLELVVAGGGVPIIVPRVPRMSEFLDSFEPFHGLLLCEGEDIDPKYYKQYEESGGVSLDDDTLQRIQEVHPSDTQHDPSRDSIEFELVRRCLQRGIPFLGVCRGSQIMNVACGGTLYHDIETELGTTVRHIDYANYDGHRHRIRLVPDTPLHRWFEQDELWVNSYHHQGVKKLAPRLQPMACADDGLVEAYYDPQCYDPDGAGQFLVGLQFHPERMVNVEAALRDGEIQYDHRGCPKVYDTFMRAVVRYEAVARQRRQQQPQQQQQQQQKQSTEATATAAAEAKTLEAERALLADTFRVAADMYHRRQLALRENSAIEIGTAFLLDALGSEDANRRLQSAGATVYGGRYYTRKERRNVDSPATTALRKTVSRSDVAERSHGERDSTVDAAGKQARLLVSAIGEMLQECLDTSPERSGEQGAGAVTVAAETPTQRKVQHLLRRQSPTVLQRVAPWLQQLARWADAASATSPAETSPPSA